MGAQTSKSNLSAASNVVATTTTTAVAAYSANHSKRRMAQNYLLLWVDGSIDETNNDCRNTLMQLKNVVNDVTTYTEPAQCVEFLNTIDQEKAFVIVSGSLGQELVPNIHGMLHLDTIYIFCGNKSRHEQLVNEWSKIKGVYTEIEHICEALQLAIKQCNQDFIAMSFVAVSEGTSTENLNQLEPTFMYTQIFKEILLEMKHDKQAIKDLAVYCRKYPDMEGQLQIIKEFKREYRPGLAIWWYTRNCFIYQMLNRALRTLEADTIINMGFFIRDLHHQIQHIHQKQIRSYEGKFFVVYRGQGLSKTDFEKLLKTKGGLMSFNNFLSTTKTKEVSFGFAKGALKKLDMFGILFVMSIDPSVSSTPFAAIKEISCYKMEDEILFSMHTVFRIGEIKQIDNNSQLYQVELQLTTDDDEQLRILTKRVGEEAKGDTGWQRLGSLLIKIGRFAKAEELYNVLLEQTSDKRDKGHYYNQLGYIKDDQGDYKKAVEYYEKSLEIRQKSLPANHPLLAISYNNIGSMYDKMGEYSKALSFYENALEIRQESLLENGSDLATSYNNIAGVYKNIEDYSEAFSFYGKALEIRQKCLPENHPLLATSYNNTGSVYDKMREYSEALPFYEKSLEIRQKSLPTNHPDLATSYNNIGSVYDNMGEYSKALLFHEKSLMIYQNTLPENHPDLAISYNNIGGVYYGKGEYSIAFSYFERALDIWQRSLPANHPYLKSVKESIAVVRKKL